MCLLAATARARRRLTVSWTGSSYLRHVELVEATLEWFAPQEAKDQLHLALDTPPLWELSSFTAHRLVARRPHRLPRLLCHCASLVTSIISQTGVQRNRVRFNGVYTIPSLDTLGRGRPTMGDYLIGTGAADRATAVGRRR